MASCNSFIAEHQQKYIKIIIYRQDKNGHVTLTHKKAQD